MSRNYLPVLTFCLLLAPSAQAEIPPIPRVLPPEGLEIPAEVRARLETRLAATKKRLEGVNEESLKPDVEVFTKAVEYALLHREFYVPKDFEKADWALDEANKRLDSLTQSMRPMPWERATGLIIRGYRSSIDGSAQPYGLVVPEGHEWGTRVPLYVWLHGRGDKATDLHFLYERATKPGQIAPPNAIVLHAFGRQCVGWKHAGEIDVLEATASARSRMRCDSARTVLIGFSMGGAGAWHIGAHYADRWNAVSPGAGFAETARYQKLTPDKYPPAYEQTLWGNYDVPDYVRNLFNTQVVAYSGELDKQIQAARVMEEAYRAEGRELTHLIGPGVEHKYEPKTLAELMKRLEAIVAEGRPASPREVHLQTRTLRYAKMHWVEALRLTEHWKDSRIDAELVAPRHVKVTTKNVEEFRLLPYSSWDLATIDGQDVKIVSRGANPGDIVLSKRLNAWVQIQPEESPAPPPLVKRHGLQGPIDDAFLSQFVVVAPTGKSRNAAFQDWCDFELAHFQHRWRALMRGELPVVKDSKFDMNRLASSGNVILWGDADSNSVIRAIGDRLPIKFNTTSWTFDKRVFDGNRFVPALVFPLVDKGRSSSYVVLNSGLTFREGHDRTNSLQNPKLPDWAIIDITQPPDAFAPGRIHDAGFFDEEWKLKNTPKGG
jgi:dienelactone hydrolase